MILYCRRLESGDTCLPCRTPDQLYDRYGEIARLRRPWQAGMAQIERGHDLLGERAMAGIQLEQRIRAMYLARRP